ncbi:MAG: SPFH domain-containing protein [Candidatus Eisenbacteria bacterium]
MTKKIVIIAVCAAIAGVVASSQYIHRGYMGVIESGDDLRLLDHGLHMKAPWRRATIYPVESRETRLEITYDGPIGKMHFDGVLLMSVCADSILKLHRSYEGAFVERLISPVVTEFLSDYADAYGLRQGRYSQHEVGEAIARRINLTLAGYGITVISVRLRSIEVAEDQLGRTS